MIVQKENHALANVYEMVLRNVNPYYCHVVPDLSSYGERVAVPVAISQGVKEALDFRDWFVGNADCELVKASGYDTELKNFVGGADRLMAFDAAARSRYA